MMKSVSFTRVIDWIALILIIVGGLNWGLVGLFHFNFIGFIFSMMPFVARLIYIIVGLAAVWILIFWIKYKKVP